MTLDRQLLEMVRCPACLGTFADLDANGGGDSTEPTELTCTGCGAAYPVRNGVPVLLVDEARRPDSD